MLVGSSGGSTYQNPSTTTDESGNEITLFETAVAMPPQVDPSNPKVISQGPSLCIFKDKNPQEVVASWLFVKFLATNVEFQAAFSMASGYSPVIDSVKDNSIYMNWLSKGNGRNNVQALAVKQAIAQKDACFVSPAFNGSSVARDEVGVLFQDALVLTGDDVDAAIAKLFSDAVKECEYQAD